MGRGVRLALRAACVAALVVATPFAHAAAAETAHEQDANIIAYANLELTGANGESSWLDRGFGKARFGGNGDGFRVRPLVSEAGVVLTPHVNWALGAVISGVYQKDQQHPFALSEAYATYRPLPIGGIRLQVKAGLFWPPISLEHSGPEWAVRDSMTPSAINSWVGEEVKVAGVELGASSVVAGQRLSLTAGLFGDNDTSGTLLAFRGWALHDEKATLFSHQPLPPLNAFMRNVQAPYTDPIERLNERVGFYLKLGWRPPLPFEVQFLHYDNRANPEAVHADLQWGWDTRFDHIGLIVDAAPQLRFIAQAMTGRTRMGFPFNGQIWVDTRFRSAFLLGTWALKRGSVSLRGEAFDTKNSGSRLLAFDDEHGWSAMIAARRRLAPFATLIAEAVHIDSTRDSRLRVGDDPKQKQTIVRLALRLRATR